MKTLSLYLGVIAALLVLKIEPISSADEANEIGPDTEGITALQEAVGLLGNPAIGRHEILVRFQVFLENYPKSAQLKRVRETCATLRKMLGEENARRFYPPKAEAKMTKKELVAELIFQLRDQTGESGAEPGDADIFQDNPGQPRSPANRLVDLEYDAVEQLITALDDDRFTRVLPASPLVLPRVRRVGDCSLAILERIAVRHFQAKEWVEDGKAAANRKLVLAWWREFYEKGERMMLIEGTERSDDLSVRNAERLAKRYPESALRSISKAIRESKQSEIRGALFALTRGVETKTQTPLLRAELKGPTLAIRLLAARELYERGEQDGFDVFLSEWKALCKWETFVDSDNGVKPVQDLMAFLAFCDDAHATTLLEREVGKLPIHARYAVVKMLRQRDCLGVSQPVNRDVQEILDRILVDRLDDIEEVPDFVYPDGMGEPCPRIGDMAAHALSLVWKKPELFDQTASIEERDQQRFEMKNLWLKKHGKPPLPKPAGMN